MTYNLIEIITGLQVAYRQMKEQAAQLYGVTIQTIGSIGISAMMHGYVACHHTGEPSSRFERGGMEQRPRRVKS